MWISFIRPSKLYPVFVCSYILIVVCLSDSMTKKTMVKLVLHSSSFKRECKTNNREVQKQEGIHRTSHGESWEIVEN